MGLITIIRMDLPVAQPYCYTTRRSETFSMFEEVTHCIERLQNQDNEDKADMEIDGPTLACGNAIALTTQNPNWRDHPPPLPPQQWILQAQ